MTAQHAAFDGSGKTAADENFPVASALLPARLRRHVAAFYRFARLADDVADAPGLAATDKLARLDALETALTGHAAGHPAATQLRISLQETGLGSEHARRLLEAFRRDARNHPCADWSELLDYCTLSAAPVGRYLLALHGEGAAAHRASDALCAALQILNHLQDARADWTALGRVYVPADWLAENGLSAAALAAPAATPALRRVLDRTLDGIDGLLAEARTLPRSIRDMRLRLEAAVILVIAEHLARRLRRRDPFAERVRLPPAETAWCFAAGILRGGLAR